MKKNDILLMYHVWEVFSHSLDKQSRCIKRSFKDLYEGLFAELGNTNVRVMIFFSGAMTTNITKNSNVELNKTTSDSPMKLLSPVVGANEIIKDIKKNKLKIFLGSDTKFLYKINSRWAIKFINKKMNNMNK